MFQILNSEVCLVATLLDNMWLMMWDQHWVTQTFLSIVKYKFNILRKEHSCFIEGIALKVHYKDFEFYWLL